MFLCIKYRILKKEKKCVTHNMTIKLIGTRKEKKVYIEGGVTVRFVLNHICVQETSSYK